MCSHSPTEVKANDVGTESVSPCWVFPVMLCPETQWLVHLWRAVDSLEGEACERRGLALGAWGSASNVGTWLRLPHSLSPGGPGTTEIAIQSQWTGHLKRSFGLMEGGEQN